MGRVHYIYNSHRKSRGRHLEFDRHHSQILYTTTTLYITYFDSSHIYIHTLVRGDQHLSSVYWILASNELN